TAFGRRHKDCAVWNRARAVIRVVVAGAKEHDVIEFIPRAPQPVDERGARWPLAVEPFQFLVERMAAAEYMVGAQSEVGLIALMFDRKPLDCDAVDAVDAGRKFIP